MNARLFSRRFLSLLLVGFLACAYPPRDKSPGILATDLATPPTPEIRQSDRVYAPNLLVIRMFDEFSGWGISDSQVLRTDDAGVSWFDVTPRGMAASGYGIFPYFLDLENVWLQAPDMNDFPNSGSLYHSNDAGRTWESYSTAFSGGSLSFLNIDEGWMMADLGAGAGSNAIAVFQTGDGGKTWSQRYTNDPNRAGAGDSLPLGGLKHGLAPLDMQTAFIFGVYYAPGAVYLYRTDDGGSTWNEVVLTLPKDLAQADINIENLEFFNETDGFLGLSLITSRITFAVYSTNDAGINWILTPKLFSTGSVVEYISPTQIVLFNNGTLFSSSNTGRTWSSIQPDVEFGESILGMDFIDPSTGWVIASTSSSDNTLFQTKDGGEHWEAVSP